MSTLNRATRFYAFAVSLKSCVSKSVMSELTKPRFHVQTIVFKVEISSFQKLHLLLGVRSWQGVEIMGSFVTTFLKILLVIVKSSQSKLLCVSFHSAVLELNSSNVPNVTPNPNIQTCIKLKTSHTEPVHSPFKETGT